MEAIIKVFAVFHAVLGGILFMSTMAKWFILKKKIEENGWKNMNPCSLLTFVIYVIPVLGPMSFLAVMTTMDEGAALRRSEENHVIAVAVGPMRYVFADDGMV